MGVRIPNWFLQWYRAYGVQNDYPSDAYGQCVRRIAWRAYRKGKQDTEKKLKKTK